MAARDEIVGREEIVGDDDYAGAELDDLVGDDPMPSRRRTYERGRPAAYQRDPRGPRVVQRDPDAARQFPIGFIADVPPGQTVNIEAKPQVLFRGERLAVATSNAHWFHIVDIKVGAIGQLAASGEMPAEAFAATTVGTRMELDTAQPGIVIVITVRNIRPPIPALPPGESDPSNTFKAVLYGTVLK